MRPFRVLPLLMSLAASLAFAGAADLPQFQYWYQPPGGDVLYAAACGPDGSMAAAALGSNTVRAYTHDGTFAGSFPAGATPLGIAVAPDGTVWVATSDASTHTVRSFSPAGAPLVTIPNTTGTLAVAPGGDVFVATTTSVQRWRPDGSLVHEWATCLTPSSCLLVQVRGIAIAPDTTVYYGWVDGGFQEIRWFRPAGGAGSFTWPWASSVRQPRQVALDPVSGELYATFTTSGGQPGVLKYSTAGDTLGSALIPNPAGNTAAFALGGVATDHAGHLHVPCSNGVARFGLGVVATQRSSWGALKQRAR